LSYITAAMPQLTIQTNRLDRVAMGLSGLCLVHCLGTAILLGLLASAGGILGSPIIHEVGLTLAMLIGSVALGRGILEHGFMLPSAIGALGLGVMAGALSLPEGGHEAVYTVAGVMILALGHRLNVMATEHDF
jgi:MerC mercury resistance protein